MCGNFMIVLGSVCPSLAAESGMAPANQHDLRKQQCEGLEWLLQCRAAGSKMLEVVIAAAQSTPHRVACADT